MPRSSVTVRSATTDDADAIASLAGTLAQSFVFSRDAFDASFAAVLAEPDACLLVAVADRHPVGYLLGFHHLTFYANAAVASVEEILVQEADQGRGVGRALMEAFERWAAGSGCALATVATRRAAPFYQALGYQESAAHLDKPLP